MLRGQAPDISSLETKESSDETDESTPVRDEESEPDGDAEDLWSYLQPHLIKHQGPKIPKQGWVPQLITLPRVRDLDWNSPWLSTHPFNDTHPRDISALILQVTGEPAPSSCDRCREGKGPFRSCIMISAKAASGPVGNILSCANCFYHFGQTYCSHKQWGTERAREILKARRERSLLDTLPGEMRGGKDDENNLGTPVGGIVFNDDESIDDQEMEQEDTDDKDMDNSAAATPFTPGTVSNNISEAEPGRLYTMWPGESDAVGLRAPKLTNPCLDENGQLASLYGALLPAGYQLDSTIPGRPWVCPVRTCRKAHCKRADLGFHFQVRGCMRTEVVRTDSLTIRCPSASISLLV